MVDFSGLVGDGDGVDMPDDPMAPVAANASRIVANVTEAVSELVTPRPEQAAQLVPVPSGSVVPASLVPESAVVGESGLWLWLTLGGSAVGVVFLCCALMCSCYCSRRCCSAWWSALAWAWSVWAGWLDALRTCACFCVPALMPKEPAMRLPRSSWEARMRLDASVGGASANPTTSGVDTTEMSLSIAGHVSNHPRPLAKTPDNTMSSWPGRPAARSSARTSPRLNRVGRAQAAHALNQQQVLADVHEAPADQLNNALIALRTLELPVTREQTGRFEMQPEADHSRAELPPGQVSTVLMSHSSMLDSTLPTTANPTAEDAVSTVPEEEVDVGTETDAAADLKRAVDEIYARAARSQPQVVLRPSRLANLAALGRASRHPGALGAAEEQLRAQGAVGGAVGGVLGQAGPARDQLRELGPVGGARRKQPRMAGSDVVAKILAGDGEAEE